jgi:membrane associated rhomboid family serine protease
VLPLRDHNPPLRPAIVNWLLIGACLVIYFFVQPGGQGTFAARGESADVGRRDVVFTFQHAAIPCEVTHDRPLTAADVRTQECLSKTESRPLFPGKPVYLAVLYSMFLHGSLTHILGNMLFLWIFGNNVEDRLGHVGYLGFYLVAGIVGAAAHVLAQPASIVPVVGASGAIAGVMGAYLVMYPNAPITTVFLAFPFVFPRIRAKWLLAFWFVSQFFLSPGSGVAWVAHVGGFLFGLLIGMFFRSRPQPVPEPVYRST